MMHYSNWLIGVKNRASLRNACKTPPNIDWNNRGNVVDMQNNNPLPNEKTSERTITARLWKKGKEVNRTAVKDPTASDIWGPPRLILLVWLFFFFYPYMAGHVPAALLL